jgi:bifunctional UDP-N-acetylglucosamine pyrophosphorylase / glucosamine-1-phosphate N-acetyltransferase
MRMAREVAVILAAGKGTRLKSRHPKAAHPLCGRPLVRYSTDLARAAGFAEIVCVVGHEPETVRAALPEGTETVLQEPQLGTGHALAVTAPLLRGHTGTLLLLQADVPLLTAETLCALLARHAEQRAAATALVARLEDGRGYGRIVRDAAGRMRAIVEKRDATPEQLAIREVNAGTYVFEMPLVFEYLERLRPENDQGELYLTDVIALLTEDGHTVSDLVTDDANVMLGINDRLELAEATAILRDRKVRELMLAGVTIEDPKTTYVDADVTVGIDTTLRPLTFLEGTTAIGEGCEIGPMTRLRNCRVGDGTRIAQSTATDAVVGDNAIVGPFAHLRPGSTLGDRVKVGDFVEINRSTLGDRTSVAHLAYVGDATVGEHVNVGAGTIFCNYDGKRKHRTTVGDEAFIGSNSTLIAPVNVGDGAFVAAASAVNQDVPADALAVARARQSVKEDWARRRREEP